MIEIEIRPAYRGSGGCYRSMGHASKGKELVCNSVTAIENCLAANLKDAWNIRADGKAEPGLCVIRWNKSDRKGAGLQRANLAAGFAYNGLKELAKKYPDEVKVMWKRPEAENTDCHGSKAPRNDKSERREQL